VSRVKPVVREATEADDEALCELFQQITMEADLRLVVERSPRFFRLYEIQRLLARRVFVGEVEGRLEGVATIMAREAWLEGERIRLGYLGDLRLAPKLRGGFFLGRRLGEHFGAFMSEQGSEVALTAIIETNAAAVRFLTKRSRRFPDKPIYRPWQGFHITNLHFTRRHRQRKGPCDVRRAQPGDLPAIAERLAEDHRARPFGYVIDEGLLQERIERWPGFELQSFFCAWRGSELVGVLAPWDAHEVKRFRVEAYAGSMRWVRAAFNVGALFLRYPKLPPVGSVLRYAYLTHQSVKHEDPAVFAALLDRVYTELHGTGLNFLTACVLDDDPVARCYDRYTTTPIPARLYLVSPPGSRFNDYQPPTGRPGFEMALV
jgi:hypothetical protein